MKSCVHTGRRGALMRIRPRPSVIISRMVLNSEPSSSVDGLPDMVWPAALMLPIFETHFRYRRETKSFVVALINGSMTDTEWQFNTTPTGAATLQTIEDFADYRVELTSVELSADVNEALAAIFNGFMAAGDHSTVLIVGDFNNVKMNRAIIETLGLTDGIVLLRRESYGQAN